MHILIFVKWSFILIYCIFFVVANKYLLTYFFKAFGVTEQKGLFPYDYFTSAEQLDETTLPPLKLFTQSLKDVMASTALG